MHSRAYILLQRDFRELKYSNYEGIKAVPVSEDKMKWKAEIKGLQNSIWHGSVLQLTINFTPEYNRVPPVVKFTVVPFHPNVDPSSGQPCIDFLDDPDKWNKRYTLGSILLALQVMLSNPMLENPVNLKAAQMLVKDESKYKRIIEALFLPSKLSDDSLELSEEPYTFIRKIRTISFNDYYKTWSEIATSKATEHDRTPLLESPHFIGQYYKWKKIELQYPKEWKLKYAVVKARTARERKMSPIAKYSIKKMPLCPTPNEVSTESQSEIHSDSESYETQRTNEISSYDEESDESWEEEVQDLVAWTKALDVDILEGDV
ncbi:ubiquitin-conjugating enzyme E2 U [Castor canadensis]|uniref:Ubiquitin-conjugating enzyme E2 U n=1 Tax=Castor canadensis TaxID=51338 RepID=A0AC58N300_CASCN